MRKRLGRTMQGQTTLNILKEAGIKPTSQRVLILEYLQKNRTHPSTEEIFQDLQNDISVLSRATVYNTVKLFKEKGLLRVVDLGHEVAHYDIDLMDHAHFQCTTCQNVSNLDYNQDLVDLPEGFQMDEMHILIKGTCNECSE